ncbi:ultraviolet-B receptor UVR8 isoform X2 [Silene latifolia]|uniref:ultraviolet-B receptor UVR8 isoform X2 n=1 Tax=Silene latifolia TaxID=37657 RepID=UPI003D786686
MEETENNEEQEQLEDTKVNSHQETATNDQEIWSWGAGTEGQLGTGKLNDEYTPQLLHNLTNSLSNYGTVSTLSCGGAHVIALTSGGKVLTWGRGASGQLGHGQVVSNCLNPKLVDCLSSFNICQVSAGWNHSGFVSDSGSLFTCGDGSFGQLGHGDCQSCSTPTEVSFFSSKHVEQVACGMRHTLVQTKGNSGDQLYGFGSNNRGQLGVSKNKIRSVSIPQPCLEFDSAQVVTVIANGDHSAAISADGNLYTWGRSFSSHSNIYVPELLSSSLSFKEAALGWNHALLLTGEGKVSMLGGRHHGTLSEPENTAPDHNSFDSENAENPKLQEVAGLDGRRAVQIAAGAEHSAVVTDDGEIWTWGWGEHGQLGLGNTNDQTLPQLVPLQNANQHKSLTSRVYCGSGFTFAVRTHLQVDEDSNNNDNIRAIPK